MSVPDLVTVALAREVRDGDVVGVGLGTPLALCACLVARRTGAPGAHGAGRRRGLAEGRRSRSACAGDFAGRTQGYVPHLDTLDMAERQAMTLQFLRPAQVGPDGSANMSRLEAGGRLVRFPGSLALADVPNLMPRDRPLPHRPRAAGAPAGDRLPHRRRAAAVERGGYRSLGPTMLVTDLCVIRFAPPGPARERPPGVDVDAVLAATGFALTVDDPPETPPPAAAELEALEAVDPARLRDSSSATSRRRQRKESPCLRCGSTTSPSSSATSTPPSPSGSKILGVLDPAQAERITFGEGVEGGEQMQLGDVRQPGRLRRCSCSSPSATGS